MRRIILTAAMAFATLLAMPASADVIFDNGGPDLEAGYYSDYSYSGGLVIAEDFVLEAGSETITDIHWWGAYASVESPNTVVADDFTIIIYGDDGGLPDTDNVLFSLAAGDVAQIDTGDTALSTYDVYADPLDIDPLTLTAGETYYIAIINNIGGWGWLTSDYGNGTHYLSNNSPFDVYDDRDSEVAFTLTNDGVGVVPEPASLLLMGLGLGGVAWRSRRKRS